MKITLLDSRHAKAGYEFVHYGGAEECTECELSKVCIENLEKGRKYRVTAVRDKEHECRLYEKVNVVEVEEPETLAAVDRKKAFAGAKITFTPLECREFFCKNSKYCDPEGLLSNDACEILEFLNAIECEKGKELVLVKLKRV
jgi:hypothetical protein